MFIIQAAIFYIPAYLWKVAEGGLLHKLCDNLGKIHTPLIPNFQTIWLTSQSNNTCQFLTVKINKKIKNHQKFPNFNENRAIIYILQMHRSAKMVGKRRKMKWWTILMDNLQAVPIWNTPANILFAKCWALFLLWVQMMHLKSQALKNWRLI